MQTRILITGSSGFLGDHLRSAARRRGYLTHGFCRSGGVQATAGDVRNASDVAGVLSSFAPRIVFHLAAQTTASGRRDDFTTNTVGVENMLRAISDAPSVEYVVWASSQLVIRSGRRPRHDEDYEPDSPYGESKMIGEMAVRRADGAGKTWTIVRPTTVWGPGMGSHYTRLLRLIKRGLYFHAGKEPVLKSFSYIDNAVDQLMALATADKRQVARRTLYLADSKPIEIHDWCNAFAREFGTRIPTVPLPVARTLATFGDIAKRAGLRNVPYDSKRLENILTSYVFDVSEIEAISGPSRVDPEEGIRRTAKWFLSQAA